MAKNHPPPELNIWEHEDIELDLPNKDPLKGMINMRGAYILHYDGGCSIKKGTGGYIAWGPDGNCIGGEYKYYGDARPTNNQSKAQSLHDGLKWLE